MKLSPQAWRLIYVIVAIGCYIGAAYVPAMAAAHLNEIAALVIGWMLPPPGKVKASAAAAVGIVLAMFSMGCSGSFEEARNPHVAFGAPPQSERCADLDDAKRTWGGVSKFSGALGGGAGLAVIPAPDEKWRTGLAIGAVTGASVAVGAAYISDGAATSWAAECSH